MAYPYIPAKKHSGTQTRVNRIVIHGTVSPTVKGGARNVARYFQSASAGGSAHYVVDPGEIVRCLGESVIAWHAPPNTNSIGVELCDPVAGPSSRWDDAAHQSMLRLAAKVVREVADRWDVPVVRLSPADLRAGKRGICGHIDVSNAWRETDHYDPGAGFPWEQFMPLIRNVGKQEDPVPDYTHVEGDATLTLRPSTWTTLTFEGDDGKHWPSFLNGAKKFSADLEIRITGLPVGTDVQTRAFEIDADQKVVERYPIQEDDGTDGTTFVHYTIGAGLLQAGRKLRVELAQFGAADAKVTVRHARLHHWPA